VPGMVWVVSTLSAGEGGCVRDDVIFLVRV
jgi:hypothetical protein